MAIKLDFFLSFFLSFSLSHGGIERVSLFLFYSFFRMRRPRRPRPIDVVIFAAAVVAILFSGAADAECSNCERRINEWCCETGWRGSCCEFPLQGGLALFK